MPSAHRWLIAFLLDIAGIEHAHDGKTFYLTALICRTDSYMLFCEGNILERVRCKSKTKNKANKQDSEDRGIVSEVDEMCLNQEHGGSGADRKEGTNKKLKSRTNRAHEWNYTTWLGKEEDGSKISDLGG